jgi:hypothetical protein
MVNLRRFSVKKTLLSTAAIALAFVASSAVAADLPSRKEAPVYIAPAPVATWTGFYAGVNLGGGWASGGGNNSYLPYSDPRYGFGTTQPSALARTCSFCPAVAPRAITLAASSAAARLVTITNSTPS